MQNSELAALSVYELNTQVKQLLERGIGQIWLTGEISNFTNHTSGHWYFSLKDDKAQVRCAMFKGSNLKVKTLPKNGQSVLIQASVTLYEARGEYQLVVQQLKLDGEGLLQQRFELLKKRLQSEGLFDAQYKKSLPSAMRTVGIITSSTGAALQDILQILNRRDPSLNLIIYPTLVQGIQAAEQIAKMIRLANARQECDVLIVGRGGGSLEDLWAFNEEIVARAIFNSDIPIVSAVGHEIDFTIADFIADIRAATPSAAAELVSRDRTEQQQALNSKIQRFFLAMDYFVVRKKERLNALYQRLEKQHLLVKLSEQSRQLIVMSNRLEKAIYLLIQNKQQCHLKQETQLKNRSPQQSIINYGSHLKVFEQQLVARIRFHLETPKQKIRQLNQQLKHTAQNHLLNQLQMFRLLTSRLNSASPLATLDRGYSITLNKQKKAIVYAEDIKIDDVLVTKLKKGTVKSKVFEIQSDYNKN